MKKILTPIALLFYSYSLFSCFCVEAPIDGSLCVECVPEGWKIESGTPDVFGIDEFPFSGIIDCEINDSQNSGGVMGLWQNEAASYQIENLVPGNTYFLKLEATACNFDYSIDFDIDIADYSDQYALNFNWEEISICFTAENETETLHVQNTTTGTVSYLLVDYISCEEVDLSEVPCDGEFALEYERELLRTCPEEDLEFLLLTQIDPDDVLEVVWECDPSIGLDYLDDDESLEPVFFLPEDDYDPDERVFEYTVFIKIGSCEAEFEIEVRIIPTEIPDFSNLVICTSQKLEDLPIESEDGYFGEWDGIECFEEYEYEDIELTFEIDRNQNNCLEEYTYEFMVMPELEIEFDLKTTFCVDDSSRVILPDESDNDVEGEWDEDKFFPFKLGEGTHEFIFIPDSEAFACYGEYIHEVTVLPAPIISFNLPTIFCLEESYTFPISSLEGIEGFWEIGLIDTLNEAARYTNIFHPTLSECTIEFSHSFEVVDPAIQIVGSDPTSCELMDGIVTVLDGEGLEFSIDGGVTWQLAPRFEQLSFGGYTVLFRRAEDGKCEGSQSIELSGGQLPVIEQIATSDPTSCENSTSDLVVLMEDDTNVEYSIDGGTNWSSENEFLDLIPGLYEIQVRFSQFPTCIYIEPFVIESILAPMIDQVIVLPTTNCEDANGVIEIISTGIDMRYSIDGGVTWQMSPVFSDLAEGSYEALVNSYDIEDCFDASSVFVDGPILPEIETLVFDPTSCEIEDGEIQVLSTRIDELEFSIDGGNSWTSLPNFEQLADGEFRLLYRLIESPACRDEVSLTLTSEELPEVESLIVVGLSDCGILDGMIDVNVIAEVEYSIDQGLTWQTEGLFENLDAGEYLVIIRLETDPECQIFIDAEIVELQAPIIIETKPNDVSDCGSLDGQIEIAAEGNDLEYSIDDGTNWQAEPLFENLDAGNYTVLVRNENHPGCFDSDEVIIQGAFVPSIDEVTVTRITDCNLQDGTIRIEASGMDLEYSIDGGLVWTDDFYFDELPPGTYQVVIREKDAPLCMTSITLEVESIPIPQLELVLLSDAFACNPSIGSFEVMLANPVFDAEFSIDGGISWQGNPTFTNLVADKYSVIVRWLDYPSCLGLDEMTINLNSETLEGIELRAENLSLCDSEDGVIEFLSMVSDLEYSIDDGQSYVLSGLFVGLEADVYPCKVRKIGSPDCNWSETVELTKPDCPCDAYALDFEQVNIDCKNEFGSISILLEQTEEILWYDGTTMPSIGDLNEGVYRFEITYDAGQCTYQDSIIITAIDPLEFGLEVFPSYCEDEDTGVVEIVDVNGGNGEYQFRLGDSNAQVENGFYNLSPGEYEIIVEDSDGCIAFEELVIELASSSLDISLGELVSLTEGDSLYLNPLIDEGSINGFQWYFEGIEIQSNSIILETAPEQSGTYVLMINYGNDCVQIREIYVEILEKAKVPRIYIPNAVDLSNNGVFYLQGSTEADISITSMMILDRWGNQVFNKKNLNINQPAEGWDPKVQNLEQGVYLYLITYLFDGQENIEYGDVTLIK